MIAHPSAQVAPGYVTRHRARRAAGIITNVIVMIQENRTIDNMFNGFCAATNQCVHSVTVDPYTNTTLQAVAINANMDPSHAHTAFVTDYDNGKMDKFPVKTIAYVPSADTTAYQKLLTYDGVLNDDVFAPNQGPSFPAHQYGIAGQAGGYDASHEDIDENPGKGNPTTCAPVSPPSPEPTILAVSLATPFPGYPEADTPICRDHETIFDLATNAGYTWRYYAEKTSGLWTPTQAIAHLYGSPNFVTPSARVLTDIRAGSLPNIVFVTPESSKSDHPGDMLTNQAGGDWVASVVDAVGESQSANLNWDNTVIILYWDDFGGWFDDVLPVFAADPFLVGSALNPNEYGLRVPYAVISAYANVGTVAHGTATNQPCSFSDSLAFIESNFNLGSLGTEDSQNTGCTAGMLDLSAAPHPFHFVSHSYAN